jgi:hypothetical protein
MKRSKTLLFCCSILLTGTVAAQITVPPDRDGIAEMSKPFVVNGQTVFTNLPGGLGNATVHSYHHVTNIFESKYVPLYFDVEHGKPGAPYYFKETYRVMYVTSPGQVVKDGGASMPTQLPPFWGNFNGPIYMVGISLNKNRSSNAPGLTPWLEMKEFKIYTQ